MIKESIKVSLHYGEDTEQTQTDCKEAEGIKSDNFLDASNDLFCDRIGKMIITECKM